MARVRMVAGWSRQLDGNVRELLETHYGPAIVEDAQAACPVDTGKLKASIHQVMRDDGMAVQIHADAKAEGRDGAELDYTYAGYVEEGTRHMAPQAFLRPALWRQRS
jgi:HK97 gp10 family phage protein